MALKGYIKNGNKMEEVCVSEAIPVGLPFPFLSNGAIPAGFLLCNGASVLRSTYPDLFAAIGTTWGAVDDLHFNLPDMRGKFPEGASVAGIYKQAGLPNITGEFAGAENQNNYFKGAFYLISEDTTSAISNSGDGDDLYGFDASRSSSIYGRSNTVQPASFTVRWIIKAFRGASINSSDLEITKVANDLLELTNRVENIANKLTIVDKFNDGYNWYRVWSDGWIEQGGMLGAGASSKTLTFNKPFTSTSYTIVGNPSFDNYTDRKTTNVVVDTGIGTSYKGNFCYWYACGY